MRRQCEISLGAETQDCLYICAFDDIITHNRPNTYSSTVFQCAKFRFLFILRLRFTSVIILATQDSLALTLPGNNDPAGGMGVIGYLFSRSCLGGRGRYLLSRSCLGRKDGGGRVGTSCPNPVGGGGRGGRVGSLNLDMLYLPHSFPRQNLERRYPPPEQNHRQL